MNKVTTTSTCGRCGAQDVREDYSGGSLPEGWMEVALWLATSPYDGEYVYESNLCPSCQDPVMAVLKPNPYGFDIPEGAIVTEAPDAD